MANQDAEFGSFQPYYEIMVDWERRIAHEAPLFQRVFQMVHARRVLDAACGTGHHACQFARWGLDVFGSDVSEKMVRRARHLAASRNLQIDFREGSFDRLTQLFDEPFDAVLCTGNSLSAAGKRSTVVEAIDQMHRVLLPDGALLLHVINYERFPPGQNYYGEPVAREHLGLNYLFLKNWRRAGTVCDMDIIVLQSGATDSWSRTVFRQKLLVLDRSGLVELVEQAGFGKLKLYGGWDMSPFNPKSSRDLIVVARRL